MKMSALSHAAVDGLTLVSLRLEPCIVPARHHYRMQPSPIERFVYITEGSALFALCDRKLEVSGGDMLYLPSHTGYDSFWREDASFMVIDILLHDVEGQPIRFGEEAGVLFHDGHGIYSGLLADLSKKAEANGPFDWLERMSLTFKLLCDMARDTNREETGKHYEVIKAGLKYLENNFAEDVSVGFLAKLCLVSKGSFRRSFAAHTGVSPIEYRNRLRIKRAETLLRSEEHTVSEVSERVGIDDVKYFGKLFKRYTGFSPGAFKKMI